VDQGEVDQTQQHVDHPAALAASAFSGFSERCRSHHG
jgi:hypothetical protein